MSRKILISILLFCAGVSYAQVSKPIEFMTHFDPISAVITEYAKKDQMNSEAGLVRMPNGKLVFMVKKNGKAEPFYIKAIETGYWDTRYDKDTNYDSVFADMRSIGANTAYVMLHWEDIETSDNVFNFAFADSVVAAAGRQDMKINWVLFLHAQRDAVPSQTPETAWTFHLDDRDSLNYTMQWTKRDGRDLRTIEDVLKYGIRPLHVYGHKDIFFRVRRMLYNLGTHYRNDKTVIGVQVGNEEGFSFLDQSDFNPITAELYQQWKLKTNKTDYALFKQEAINWWWSQFTSAFHEADPYKFLSFNLDAGQPEGEDLERIKMTGTSAATYADGNLDAIGTMFYKDWGDRAFAGLDNRYNNGSYNYKLPILIPSEIGIGNFNTPATFRQFVIKSLERAAQGFGVYCYGDVRKELPQKAAVRADLEQMFADITANEDVIFGGLPGPGEVCFVADTVAKVSHLNVTRKTLAMIYFPKARLLTKEEVETENRETVDVTCVANVEGQYVITTFLNGKEVGKLKTKLKKGQSQKMVVEDVAAIDIIFVKAEKI